MEDEVSLEIRVSRGVRIGAALLCVLGMPTLISALHDQQFLDAAFVFVMLVLMAPIAISGKLPRHYLGMSQEEVEALYARPFRLEGDRTGIMTTVFVLAFILLLLISTAVVVLHA